MNHDSDPARWEKCPPGALSGIAKREEVRVHRRRIFRATLAAGVLSCVLVSGWWVVGGLGVGSGKSLLAGISCEDVQAQLPDLVAGRLDGPFADQIREHLGLCPLCQKVLNELTAQESIGRAPYDNHRFLAIASVHREQHP